MCRKLWRRGALQAIHASARSHCHSMGQQASSRLAPCSVSAAATPPKPLALAFPSLVVASTCGAGRCIGQIVGTEFAKCLVGLAKAMLANLSSSVAKQTMAGQSIFACAALHASFCFMVGDGFVLKQPKKNVPIRHADKLHQARTSASNWDAKLEIAQERALLFLRGAAVGVCRSDFNQHSKAAHASVIMSVFPGL